MADVFSKEKRSEVMSHIRGRGNRDTELAIILIFQKNGIIGWRRNMKIIGKPDFLFPKNRIAVFIDGCFWHCCRKHSTLPKNNHKFWLVKLTANKKRDLQVSENLISNRWFVVRFWEHELKKPKEIVNKMRFIIFCSEHMPEIIWKYFAICYSRILLLFHNY